MNRQTSLCVSVLLAVYGLACGSDEAVTGPAPIAGPASTGTASPTAAPTAAPTATNAASPVVPVAAPAAPAAAAPTASGTAAATPPVQAGGDTAAPMAADGVAETGGNGARYPDACSERRGSWGKPCSSNPDPCNLKSGYPGDDYCLLPPPEGKGVQIHFGPKSYTDKAEVAKYLMQPGDEFNQYAIVNIPTTETKWYAYLKISMRPGSHHLINNLVDGHPTEGFVEGGGGCEGGSAGGFPGTQNLIVESPPQGIPAPENEGLGRELPGNASICQNYHRYNVTDSPALSEIWYNVWFAEESEITQKASGVMINAGPWSPISPGEKIVLTTSATAGGDGRIISLFGHRHAATERFEAYLNDKIIYDSWDWVESRTFNYDSITQNPPIDPAGMMDGAISGILPFKSGDEIMIKCHVNNMTENTLTFANELYTGEMCILFGSTVGTGISKQF